MPFLYKEIKRLSDADTDTAFGTVIAAHAASVIAFASILLKAAIEVIADDV
jgi:hypothetical protein